jgi:lambda family phage portal protein
MFETLQKYMDDSEKARLNEPVREAQKETKKSRRSYKAAQRNRLTSDWILSPTGTNNILRGDLRRLRERSQDLCRNDPYAKKFLRLVRNNVVGTGITLQVKPSGKPIASDTRLSKTVEDAFKEWSKKENCSASGKLSWLGVQQLFATHLAKNGEAILRKVADKTNKFGFSLKFYNAAWLDETYNDTLPGGNRVIMSVEVDDFDRPVAYWLTQPAGEYPRRQKERYRTRVPAQEIIHAFLIDDDEDQTRGVPWLHASMVRLKMFDGYEEAELVGKRTEVCHMAFFIPPNDEPQQATEDGEGNQAELIQEAEPGIFAELPPGYDVKNFAPKQDAGASDFKTHTMQGIAAGADVSHHSLTGDLSRVNFSSARIGSLEERDNYTAIQEFFIEHLCEPVYKAWLESSFLTGALQISLKDYARVQMPTFRGRGWSWVNPKDDADAAVTGLENGFMTLTGILAERGEDLEDHFQTLAKEKELAAKYRIVLKHSGEKETEIEY